MSAQVMVITVCSLYCIRFVNVNDECLNIEQVQCDDCDAWYHTACVGCTDSIAQLSLMQFHCGCAWRWPCSCVYGKQWTWTASHVTRVCLILHLINCSNQDDRPICRDLPWRVEDTRQLFVFNNLHFRLMFQFTIHDWGNWLKACSKCVCCSYKSSVFVMNYYTL